MADLLKYTALRPAGRTHAQIQAELLRVNEPNNSQALSLYIVKGAGAVPHYDGLGDPGTWEFEVRIKAASLDLLIPEARLWKSTVNKTTGTIIYNLGTFSETLENMTLTDVAERKLNRYQRILTLSFVQTIKEVC